MRDARKAAVVAGTLLATLDGMTYREADLAALADRRNELELELRRIEKEMSIGRKHRRLPLLAQVEIATPCDARWEDMHGDERVRHCDRCDRDVFDLSETTSREAEALLRAHANVPDGPCLRVFRRADGTVLTRDCPLGRRQRLAGRAAVSLLAAGTFAAAQTLYTPAMGRSPVRVARSDAMTVRSAAEMFLAEDPSADCPTMKDLVSAHIINSVTNTTDPWGHDFRIRCDGTEITVTSDGLVEHGGADDD